MYTAPSGPPRSLSINSTNLSTITIEWEEIECSKRNGPISSYNVTYTIDGETVRKKTQSLMFTAHHLEPRTSYTFSIKGISTVVNEASASESITASTTAPQGTAHCCIIFMYLIKLAIPVYRGWYTSSWSSSWQ